MNLNDILHKQWVVPTIVGVAGIGVGIGIGIVIGQRKENARIMAILADEVIESTNALKEQEAYLEPVEEVEEAKDEAKDEPEIEVTLEEVEIPQPDEDFEPVTVTRNVFHDAPNDQWVWEDELAAREGRESYVIHQEEFMNNEKDYQQETLTYYMGDDIMCGEDDQPLYDYNNLMGDLKFGHGSGDPNVVYIRNDAIHMEWEILRHEGRFQVEVLGLEIEEEYEKSDLKHSHHRFRPD